MLADSVTWLFVARGIQGIATGLAIGAASAALLDLHPTRDTHSVGLANGVASASGMGLGVLVSSLVIETLPAPRVLPYVVGFGLFAFALAGAWRMPEPVERRGRLRLTPEKPGVPRDIRGPFALAALGVISSWSIGGLFMSLGPQLAATILGTTDHLATGAGVFALAASGALAQLAFGRVAPWLGAAGGSVALAAGLLLVVLAAATGSAAAFVAGAIVAGAGFGVAFLGGLRTLSAVIPADHRARVMSAFYIVAYSAISIPAILAGLLVTPLGLEPTFELFGSVVAAIALVVAVGAWRSRPQPVPACARVASAA
jgi:MFS family permease